MLQLRCTQKVQKALGLKLSDLSPVRAPNSLLGNWYVNLFSVDRRKTFIFMNEKTLLSFIIFGVRKNNIKNLPESFIGGLEQALTMEGLNISQINRVFADYKEIEFTKTDSRSVLGNLNDLVWLYKNYILDEGGYKYCNLGEIIRKLNNMPQRNIGWSKSSIMLRAILES